MVLAHPRVKIFFANPLEICGTGNFNVVLRLVDVDAVEQVDEAKAFQRDGEVFVDEVEYVICDGLCWGRYTEVINLAQEENTSVGYVA